MDQWSSQRHQVTLHVCTCIADASLQTQLVARDRAVVLTMRMRIVAMGFGPKKNQTEGEEIQWTLQLLLLSNVFEKHGWHHCIAEQYA